ncbi:Allatostatin-A receptor [Lucilia cuprina]|nr:Allatostatin-A receptor [Lucilia cuprina]
MMAYDKMSHHMNHTNMPVKHLQQITPQAQTLSSSLAIACSEWLNATECANITFAIGKQRFATATMADGSGGGGVGNATPPPDNLMEMDLEMDVEWPLERVVSTIVPVFFGIIGLAGLLGNALVILVTSNAESLIKFMILNLNESSLKFFRNFETHPKHLETPVVVYLLKVY